MCSWCRVDTPRAENRGTKPWSSARAGPEAAEAAAVEALRCCYLRPVPTGAGIAPQEQALPVPVQQVWRQRQLLKWQLAGEQKGLSWCSLLLTLMRPLLRILKLP